MKVDITSQQKFLSGRHIISFLSIICVVAVAYSVYLTIDTSGIPIRGSGPSYFSKIEAPIYYSVIVWLLVGLIVYAYWYVKKKKPFTAYLDFNQDGISINDFLYSADSIDKITIQPLYIKSSLTSKYYNMILDGKNYDFQLMTADEEDEFNEYFNSWRQVNHELELEYLPELHY